MNRVHICAPGPSLDWSWFGPEHLYDTIIVVNLALHGAPVANFWVCIDNPNSVHELCRPDWQDLEPHLVTREKRFRVWEGWGLDRSFMRDSDALKRGTWTQDVERNCPYSISSAIDLAASLDAREIHFHGVDMAGSGYFGGQDPRPASATHAGWERRWESKERPIMRRFYQAAQRAGVCMVGLPASVTDELEVEPEYRNDPPRSFPEGFVRRS